jgi:hypothetical protein
MNFTGVKPFRTPEGADEAAIRHDHRRYFPPISCAKASRICKLYGKFGYIDFLFRNRTSIRQRDGSDQIDLT